MEASWIRTTPMWRYRLYHLPQLLPEFYERVATAPYTLESVEWWSVQVNTSVPAPGVVSTPFP